MPLDGGGVETGGVVGAIVVGVVDNVVDTDVDEVGGIKLNIPTIGSESIVYDTVQSAEFVVELTLVQVLLANSKTPILFADMEQL